MKFNKLIQSLAVLLILLTFFGCQQFKKIKVEQYNNQLFFDFETLGNEIQGKKQYLLYDISVGKLNCSANCVIWKMVRKEEYFDSNEYALKGSKVMYGAAFDMMKTSTKPVPLSAGKYSVAANVSLVVDGQFIKAARFIQDFQLSATENGQLILRNN